MKKTNTPKLLHGIDADDYFGQIIGPMAAAVLEKVIWQAALTVEAGDKLSSQELKTVQFAIEKTYGAATRQVEHVKVSDAEIVAEQLGHLDTETLRLIAGTNAPKPSEPLN